MIPEPTSTGNTPSLDPEVTAWMDADTNAAAHLASLLEAIKNEQATLRAGLTNAGTTARQFQERLESIAKVSTEAAIQANANLGQIASVRARAEDTSDDLATLEAQTADILRRLNALERGEGVPTPTPPPSPTPTPTPPPTSSPIRRRLSIHSLGFPDAIADTKGAPTVHVFDFDHFGSDAALLNPASPGWDAHDRYRYSAEGISNHAGIEATIQPSAWPIRDRSPAHTDWLTKYGDSIAHWQQNDPGATDPYPLAPGHEMNGAWTNKSSWNAQDWSIVQTDDDPEAYADWWRYVVATIRSTGARIQTIWAPAHIWPAHEPLLARAYPGDDHVDIVALSWYPHSGGGLWPRRRPNDNEAIAALSLEAQFETLKRLAPGKPVGINETGFGHAIITGALIDEFWDVMIEHEAVLAKYFNRYKRHVPSEQDYRLFNDRELDGPSIMANRRDHRDRFLTGAARWIAAQ